MSFLGLCERGIVSAIWISGKSESKLHFVALIGMSFVLKYAVKKFLLRKSAFNTFAESATC